MRWIVLDARGRAGITFRRDQADSPASDGDGRGIVTLWSRATAREIVEALGQDEAAGLLDPVRSRELIARVWARAADE